MDKYYISTAKSRLSTNWTGAETTWATIAKRLAEVKRTHETFADYQAMGKEQRGRIKDIGGFVAARLNGPRRKAEAVVSRSMLTYDVDNATDWSVWETLGLTGYTACMYTTHSHAAEAPRYRIVMPLSRECTPDEYQAVARRIASVIDDGLRQMDRTTYEPSRLMYWPSASKDGEFISDHYDGIAVDVDEVLAEYTNWRDISQWPGATQETDKVSKEHLDDPKTKPGVIGAWCRIYDIPAAINEYLADIYTPVKDGDTSRYTYAGGTTSGGLVVYDNGAWAYSHHANDPCCGRNCNAFDLVRIHLYGNADKDAKPDTPVNKLPSYIAMQDLCNKDEAVRVETLRSVVGTAEQDFGGKERTRGPVNQDIGLSDNERDEDVLRYLDTVRSGKILPTIHNVEMILEHDKRLRGALSYNEFTGRQDIVGDLPWRHGSEWTDADESNLRSFIERVYEIGNTGKIADAVSNVLHRHAYHPVRDYLNGLTWDGVQRLDTLLIDALGADDTPYVRGVTRKTFCAAVARIMRPGVKFDQVLLLVGDQGTGKSTLIKRMGRQWVQDALPPVGSKEAYEAIQGQWLIELAELSAMSKADVETVKAFISKTDDTYRAAYARHTETRLRQCVFFGTTNQRNVLLDSTGNRRWWPVDCHNSGHNTPADLLTDGYVDQVWAEAVVTYKGGETLWIDDNSMAAEAIRQQDLHKEDNAIAGLIRKWIDTPVPYNWDSMSVDERRTWYAAKQDYGRDDGDGVSAKRKTISVMEVWVECLGKRAGDMAGRKDSLKITEAIREAGCRPTGLSQRTPYGVVKTYEVPVTEM